MPAIIHSSPDMVESAMSGPGLTSNDSLARAGRRVLRFQLEQLSTEDWCVQEGESPRSGQVHQLRVTTRRMRSTLRVFKPYYKAKAVQPVVKGLRDLSDALARVREQDVAVRALKSYQQAVDDEARMSIQPVLDAWRMERREAHAECGRYLNSEQHAAWLLSVSSFVRSEDADRALEPGEPFFLRHALDVMMAQHIAEVRAYDTLADLPSVKDIHSLRIAIKRLRYVCEGLSEVLPAERMGQIVSACTAAQDAYGELVDAHLSADRALRYVAEHRAEYGDPQAVRNILAFTQTQQEVVDNSLAGWRAFMKPLLML